MIWTALFEGNLSLGIRSSCCGETPGPPCRHDEILHKTQSMGTMGAARSLQDEGNKYYPRLSKELREVLELYRMTDDTNRLPG
jgi:hypothetical protein